MATTIDNKLVTLAQAKIIWDEVGDNTTDIATLQATTATHTTSIADLQSATVANADDIADIQAELNDSVATMSDFRTYLGIQEEQSDNGNGDSGNGE